ncbi:hypothetical protein HZS_2501, partial [Henneguya salminicola]
SCEQILGCKINFSNANLLDFDQLCEVFKNNKIEAVIHFAGLKSVGESVANPLHYYNNNICGTINLLRAMEKYGVNKIVFSSSATVYGVPQYLPIDEDHPAGNCSNPYGLTKYFNEIIIRDHMKSVNGSYIHLRYFNPVGASESGRIGESPNGIPNNLFPFISDVAVGKLPLVNVYGDDYDTIDGTGVRDYIHIVDLAKGHTQAIKFILSTGCIFNLGTGKGYSVLEVIKVYESVCGRKIPFKVIGRRPGDVACCYADNTLAKKKLKWSPQYDLHKMCKGLYLLYVGEDSWN